jgi:hypothetical protein
VLSVLRKANACRTTNFDLINDEGWNMLVADIAEDFPHLTLADLNTIIKLGYKGELDEYKNLPLNYTRIYQWIKKESPKQSSAWRAKFPEVFAWANMLGLADKLYPKLTEKAAVVNLASINEGIALTELRELMQYNQNRPSAGPRWVNEAAIGPFHEVLAKFIAIYPEWSAKRGHLLC